MRVLRRRLGGREQAGSRVCDRVQPIDGALETLTIAVGLADRKKVFSKFIFHAFMYLAVHRDVLGSKSHVGTGITDELGNLQRQISCNLLGSFEFAGECLAEALDVLSGRRDLLREELGSIGRALSAGSQNVLRAM